MLFWTLPPASCPQPAPIVPQPSRRRGEQAGEGAEGQQTPYKMPRRARLAPRRADARSPARLAPAQVAEGGGHIKGTGFARLRTREGVNYRL